MSSIQTGIELNDQFSGVLNNIISSVNLAVSAMYDMQQSMNADIDTSSLEGARDEINQATAAIEAMNQAASQQTAPNIAPPVVDGGNGQVINVDVNPVLPDPLVENPEPIRPEIQPNAPPDPEPVEIPVTWNTDGMDVFTGTGVERFQQEVQSANDMLNTLNTTQARISQTAQGMDILPDAAVQDMNTMQQRLSAIQQRIQQIENNPVNVGADNANAELEQLRMQLNQAIQEQNSLNQAMQNMDVSAANDAYLRLSQTVGNTERYIRDNVDEQGRFNQEISAGTQQANELTNTIKRAVAAYVSIQTVGKALNISDELVQTTSRLNMMNDGVQTTAELVNMVYAAAQDARGSFSQMADVVARFGNNAKDAFSSSEEVVAFADLIQKQMTIAGASTQEAANAELQLSQALGSGVLRGDELNSIFEQAPNLIQNIADYLDVPIGKIREMAADGELSADVVKAAIFSAADDINSKFNEMPMTWGQMWQSMQNTALIAFQPVLQRLNDLANSEAFQTFIQGAIEAMATLANILLNVFDLAVSIGTFIGDNWSIIAPIVYGIVAALTAYIAISAIVAAINGVMAIAEGVKAAAQMMATGATFAETAAQQGLNAALMACPLTWIIMLILALIVVIFAVCNAIAKMTGIANSGFGVITGGVNVVIQFFKNLGLTVANIALGIGNAIAALASNMMTAFHNAICSVQSWFYNLLSTALSVIEGICSALNKLPFVEFDYSGISSAADDYAAKASEAAGNKEDYQSISDAFNEGFTTFDAFQDGWASDAFNAGAAWGDGVADKVSNFSLSDVFGQTDIPNVGDYTSGFADAIANSGVGDGIGNIDDNTGKIKDSLDITEEDLKYLRDIAEQEAINRFTTAEVTINQTNNNNVSSDTDLDGFITALDDAMGEAIDEVTNGGTD
ncbi:phage tail tape measure protein [Eubacterium ramulus]|mgnify:FL=1|uniref:Tape measure protein n=1 Tax=Eubacterium ramulus TaxID=39490 RepID=A0A844E0Q2_EUBRA|nr:tape measure protein [Eubacterium ramulus]MSC93052.1 tape measure protein [Eubacterium ramulus]MSD15224.1 tape measure protein [Eubacterium ramulus]RYS98940.1 phage tail tape measure protein [Eubacterium ramulus]